MKNNNWIPVSSGLFPEDMEDVQVTYIGHDDHLPYCDAFAYRDRKDWFWSFDGSEVEVRITAWRVNCEPYNKY